MTAARKLLSRHLRPSTSPARKKNKRKGKVLVIARPKRRPIKSIGYYVELMLLPMVVMLLTFELGYAMSIGHGQNDSSLDIHESTLSFNANEFVHSVRFLNLMYNISIS